MGQASVQRNNRKPNGCCADTALQNDRVFRDSKDPLALFQFGDGDAVGHRAVLEAQVGRSRMAAHSGFNFGFERAPNFWPLELAVIEQGCDASGVEGGQGCGAGDPKGPEREGFANKIPRPLAAVANCATAPG